KRQDRAPLDAKSPSRRLIPIGLLGIWIYSCRSAAQWTIGGVCGKCPGDGGSRRNELRYACLSPTIDPVARTDTFTAAPTVRTETRLYPIKRRSDDGYASEVLQKLIRHKSGQTNLGHDVPEVQMRSLAGEWRNEHDPEEG